MIFKVYCPKCFHEFWIEQGTTVKTCVCGRKLKIDFMIEVIEPKAEETPKEPQGETEGEKA